MKAVLILSLLAVSLSAFTVTKNKEMGTDDILIVSYEDFKIPSSLFISKITLNFKSTNGGAIETLVGEIGTTTNVVGEWWMQAGTKNEYLGQTGSLTWTFTEGDKVKYDGEEPHFQFQVYWANRNVILTTVEITTERATQSSSQPTETQPTETQPTETQPTDSGSTGSGNTSGSQDLPPASGSTTGKCGAFAKFPEAQAICEKYAADYSSKFKTIFKDGPVYTGDGTDYGDGNGGGNCLFPKEEYYKDKMYAAINNAQYNTDMGCGLCALVVTNESPKNAIRVRMIDQCPECAKGSLDFSDTAWHALTNIPPGRIKITWTVIPCDIPVGNYPALVSGNLKFKFKSGSSQYWSEVQVFNTVYPVAKLEAKVNGSWVALTRKAHNYWGEASIGGAPFVFRVTLADGSVIIAEDVPQAIPGDDEGTTNATGKQHAA